MFAVSSDEIVSTSFLNVSVSLTVKGITYLFFTQTGVLLISIELNRKLLASTYGYVVPFKGVLK